MCKFHFYACNSAYGVVPSVNYHDLVNFTALVWQCSRPGILVLVNDTDWELTGTLQTLVEDGDTVTFISTLHGG